ncbi:MAG: hypothetical protein RL040_719 [Bacteroidota bacterium]|jgi:bacillithiol biosynthesis cysteine-adding enzyme BshC
MPLRSFPDLEFRKLDALVADYCRNSASTREFYACEPSLDAIAHLANTRQFSLDNSRIIADVLAVQYAQHVPIQQVNENVRAFADGNAICVTTGHQLCLLGGPAYFIYKILSAIKLAQNLQPLVPTKKIVPVFWLASEDHDREEINHTFINGTRLEWNTAQTGAVGRFSTVGFDKTLQLWINSIEDEHLRDAITPIWNRAMQFDSWGELTLSWVHECFGEWGLVIIEPDNSRLKQLFKSVMKRELLEGVAEQSVSKSNERLSQLGYHVQVNPRDINLFYLGEQTRVRIERHGEYWSTVDNRHRWNEDEILLELEHHPENFSPNVLLRPLYQETILPNVAYIGGPGELAYWLQLKILFEGFEVSMPALVLRNAAIIVSHSVSKRLSKLGLTNRDLLRDKQDLITALAGDKPDFSDEKSEFLRLFERLADRVAQTDSTLRASAMAEAQRTLAGIDQLQAKTWKAIKVKEEQKLTALDKMWEEIYPSNNWQERSQNILIDALRNDKQLMRELLQEFQSPASTMVIVEF